MIKNDWITTSLTHRTKDNLNDFAIQLNPHPFELDTFANNSSRVAREICETNDRVYLLYSGGLDSEYVVKVFRQEKLPHTVVIVDAKFNRTELAQAVAFCKTYSIRPLVVSFTKNQIVDQSASFASEMGFGSTIGTLPCLLANQLDDGTIVTGTGEPFYDVVLPPEKQTPYTEYNCHSESDFYLHYTHSKHVGSFYTYDLALHFSMVNEMQYSGDIRRDKSTLYQLINRPKIRWDDEYFSFIQQIPQVKRPIVYIRKQMYLKALQVDD